MTNWQWSVIIALVKIVLGIVTHGEYKWEQSDIDLLKEAVDRDDSSVSNCTNS